MSHFRSCVVAALVAAFVASPCAATTPACAQAEPDRALPAPALCLRHAGVAAGATPGATAEALFGKAERSVADGRFDEAETALDCADAVLGANGDATARYELVRRWGILDYKRERIPEALFRFECALDLAKARDDRTAIARDLKNVGSALRRLGDFQGALDALLESLALQRADGEPGGMVLRNIADVYREIDESAEAMRHYREALDAFARAGDEVEVGHTLETMSLLALDEGDDAQAKRWLEDALRTYRESDHAAYRLRVYAGLIRVALAQGALADAQAWRDAGLAVAAERDLPLPAPLQLQIARLDRLTGRVAQARTRLESALAALPDGDTDRPLLLEELVAVHAADGDRAAAVDALQRLRDAERRLERARYDRELGWLRTRFETAERDRTIVALEHENRTRTLTVWLISVSALAALSILSMLFLRWRQRLRLAEVGRLARYEEELARYRREADALSEDRSLLQALLDSRDEAICLLDADGTVLAANRGACALLAMTRDALGGRAFAEALGEDDARALASALERMQDVAEQRLSFAGRGAGPGLRADLRHWEQGDGLIVLTLCAETADDASSAEARAASIAAAPRTLHEPEVARRDFRQSLVELMLAAIDAWESSTGTGRLELAEKSRIWRVNIDDGRLRARVMERYLSLSKLPRNPRWRDVVRSAYFVLGHCALEDEVRASLKRRIDVVLAYTRRSALV